MLPRYGSRLLLALLLLGGVFLLANTYIVALVAGGAPGPAAWSAVWGLGLVTALLLGVPGLLFVLGWAARSSRTKTVLAMAAGEAESPEATSLVLETFRSAVGQLQAQRSELQRLNQQARARLVSAELLSAHIVAGVPSGLVAFDAEGCVMLLNGPAQTLLSAPDGAQGLSARALLRRAPGLAAVVEDCLANGTVHPREEATLHTAEGYERRLGASVTPFATPQGVGVLCLFTDLTEVTRLREEVALKKNLESLGEMSAGLAHEFKNSLAALQTYAQLLQNQSLTDNSRAVAGEMLDEVRQLSEMVSSFLSFARPRPLQLAETNLGFLLEDCAEELEGLYQAHGVSLSLAGVWPDVPADERMLRQALLNLLRNAAEAFDGQECVAPAVLAQGETRPGRVVITIQDNGPGLAPENLERVFIPFFTTKAQGHGVGLALAHRVITQHGGTLTAANAPDSGAIFKVELPLTAGNEQQ